MSDALSLPGVVSAALETEAVLARLPVAAAEILAVTV